MATACQNIIEKKHKRQEIDSDDVVRCILNGKCTARQCTSNKKNVQYYQIPWTGHPCHAMMM